jgi:outer membrane protein insertion porin family
MNKKLCFSIFFFLAVLIAQAQVKIGNGDTSLIDYSIQKEYEIGGISVSGSQFFDESSIIGTSGLKVGQKITIPGDNIARAINNLWKQGLFSDIKIMAPKIKDNMIFLEFVIEERPRLSRFSFTGVTKGEADKLRDVIDLVRGKVVTQNVISTTIKACKAHFVEKGYLNTEVKIKEERDTSVTNSESLVISVDKKERIKINNIIFHGVTAFKDIKLKRAMSETKVKHWYRIFKSSKLIADDYEKDKASIIAKYKEIGYRDAKIVSDTFYKVTDNLINIEITINEGDKYYFGTINWVGNTKHTTQELNRILGINKGDVFNQTLLDERLFMSESTRDISSLYLDDGYLFFGITPIELAVSNDTIDYEMRIVEGKQATINKITVTGNTKTSDKVILRELKTKPGMLFSRSDIIRSQRELAQLNYFNAEKLGVNPKPNPADGTVDIEYVVEEKPSDQIELSGGWGNGSLVGTLGVSFNNFSMANFFNKDAWTPLPSGDGQKFSIRGQTNGTYYQAYNASFTEPWLGGKKPNALSVTASYSIQTNNLASSDPNYGSLNTLGLSVGLGKRLAVPDDYFYLYSDLGYQNFNLKNYPLAFLFSSGHANNFSLRETFSRNSIDQPTYPRSGSSISLSVQLTPPYSLFSHTDYSALDPTDHYKWIEYNKWEFQSSWFTNIVGNLVFNTRARYGFLNNYTSNYGQSPINRFFLGGDGISGFALDGRELIPLRGYVNNSVTPEGYLGSTYDYIGASVFDKYTLELRYPISLNPQATVYVEAFAEGGNSWLNIGDFNPFLVHRSAGGGVRIFLPIFGTLGLDWGYGFDPLPGDSTNTKGKGQFAFSIGGSIDQ